MQQTVIAIAHQAGSLATRRGVLESEGMQFDLAADQRRQRNQIRQGRRREIHPDHGARVDTVDRNLLQRYVGRDQYTAPIHPASVLAGQLQILRHSRDLARRLVRRLVHTFDPRPRPRRARAPSSPNVLPGYRSHVCSVPHGSFRPNGPSREKLNGNCLPSRSRRGASSVPNRDRVARPHVRAGRSHFPCPISCCAAGL